MNNLFSIGDIVKDKFSQSNYLVLGIDNDVYFGYLDFLNNQYNYTLLNTTNFEIVTSVENGLELFVCV